MLPSARRRRDGSSGTNGPVAMNRVSLALAACLAAGCGASKIDLPHDCRLAEGYGAVVGRLAIVANDREIGFSSLLGESTGGVFLLSEPKGDASYVPLGGDGTFFWSLRAGTYRIAGFEYQRGGRSGRVMARFDVEAGAANHIGTLAVDVAGGRFVTRIVPDDEGPPHAFHARCPGTAMEGRNRPMRIEEER